MYLLYVAYSLWIKAFAKSKCRYELWCSLWIISGGCKSLALLWWKFQVSDGDVVCPAAVFSHVVDAQECNQCYNATRMTLSAIKDVYL